MNKSQVIVLFVAMMVPIVVSSSIVQFLESTVEKAEKVLEESLKNVEKSEAIVEAQLADTINKSVSETLQAVDKELNSVVDLIVQEKNLPSTGYTKTTIRAELDALLKKRLTYNKYLSDAITGMSEAEQKAFDAQIEELSLFTKPDVLKQAVSMSDLVKSKGFTVEQICNLATLRRETEELQDKFLQKWNLDISFGTKFKVQLQSVYQKIKSLFSTNVPEGSVQLPREELEAWAKRCGYSKTDNFIGVLQKTANDMEMNELVIQYKGRGLTKEILQHLVDLAKSLPKV